MDLMPTAICAMVREVILRDAGGRGQTQKTRAWAVDLEYVLKWRADMQRSSANPAFPSQADRHLRQPLGAHTPCHIGRRLVL